jgi:hypothetical protein
MHDALIQRVAELMTEQTAAYARLESATAQLTGALALNEPQQVESLTRAGESELLRMRSRLVEITSALTKFAEIRASETEKTTLDPQSREEFETAAKHLIDHARKFKKICERASSLANGASSFTSACIQMCGVPPSTYRAPVLRPAEMGGAAR